MAVRGEIQKVFGKIDGLWKNTLEKYSKRYLTKIKL